jgi:hypothetical protein
MAMSPLSVDQAVETSRLLSQYGGCIIQDGIALINVVYLRCEGHHVPRIIHMEEPTSRETHQFILDEVSGRYVCAKRELWPLSKTAEDLGLLCIHRLLPPELARNVQKYLQDVRPFYADPLLLRHQVLLDSEIPSMWEEYWQHAERYQKTSKRGRCRQNIWPSRKRQCMIDE